MRKFVSRRLGLVRNNELFMKNYFLTLFCVVLFMTHNVHAFETKRIKQLSNNRVNIWKTIIYPNAQHSLPMHRHEYNRVLVALSKGVLKITNNKGEIHYLKLEKDKTYYLTKNIPNELHRDENVSHHPITVLVIELKD